MITLAALLALPLGALAAPVGGASAAALPAAALPTAAPEPAEAPTPLTGTAGLIHASGVDVASTPSILPSGGDVTISVSVHNLTEHPVPGTVDFWITTPWGARVSQLAPAKVKALAPGEKRTLTARVHGPGQWALVTGHARFTPPGTVDGLATPPKERSALLVVPPFFALAALAVLALSAIVLVAAQRRRRAEARTTAPHASGAPLEGGRAA